MIRREELIQTAKQVEEASYWAGGRGIDGAPYDADPAFLDLAFEVLGRSALKDGDTEDDAYKRGVELVEDKIRERKSLGESRAQIDCGNWLMWTIFNLLEVSRVRK
ncbi:MAG: hypothetical protein ABI758_00585 [Candidatus Woesebacteria bacterium]